MKVDDYAFGLGIIEHWIPMLTAAELYDPAQNVMNVVMLAGAVMRDEIVASRHAAKLRRWRPNGKQQYPPSDDYFIEVLRAMTPVEKTALKARIVARHKPAR